MTQEEVNINRAIEESMKANVQGSYEPLELENRARLDGEPVGLKNVGNTCYFNSLMQTLFQVEPLVKAIVSMKNLDKINIHAELDAAASQSHEGAVEAAGAQKKGQNYIEKRKKESIELVKNLKELFISLMASNQKYTDPSNVLNHCVDDMGEQVKIGDQKDIIEYATVFFERLDEVCNMLEAQTPEKQQKTPQKIDNELEGGAMKEEKIGEGNQFEFQKDGKTIEPGPMDEEKMLQRSYSEYKTPTLKMKTSISMKSITIIQKLFFGITRCFIIKDGVEGAESHEELFGPVLLDPTTNNFYKSWENHFYNKLEAYVDDSSTAYKWDLITKLPDILCFQINRARYNKERKTIEKNNQRFEFEREIFADRYLFENKLTLTEKKKLNDKLDEELAQVQKELNSIDQYKDGRSILSSMQDVLSFLAKHSEEGKIIDETVVTTLKKLESEVKEKWNKLHERRREIEEQMKELYKDIQKTKYEIFSIIIHAGTADSGHFYCYIRNHNNKWFKFNDFHVREAEEKEVLETAYGNGVDYSSAYCVFYMKADMFKHYEGHNFLLDIESSAARTSGYCRFTPVEDLYTTIQKNHTLERDIKKIKAKKIASLYESRSQAFKSTWNENYNTIRGKVFALRAVSDYIYKIMLDYGDDKWANYTQNKELLNIVNLYTAIKQFRSTDKSLKNLPEVSLEQDKSVDLHEIVQHTSKLNPHLRITNTEMGGITKIAYNEMILKYRLTVELVFMMNELLDSINDDRIKDFFGISNYILNFVVSSGPN